MNKLLLVTALLFSTASDAGSWQYQPWQTVSATPSLEMASLGTTQSEVDFRIQLESRDKQPPVWVVTISSADKIMALESITAINPDRVQISEVQILGVERFAGEKDGNYRIRAALTPDGINDIKFATRVEVVADIEGSEGCATCRANAKYTVDTSGLGLAFVQFDIDVRRLEGVDVRRAYLLEFDRNHEPLDTVPQDLWMITPAEVERHRVKLGLSKDEILAMSRYDISDALMDQESREFDERQAARAARDAAANEAGDILFRTLEIFEFPAPDDCLAPDIPQVITSQEQAAAFDSEVSEYQTCLRANQERDAGAYSAVIGTIGYAMSPDSFQVSEPDDPAFSGAVLIACEGLVPEVGQCSAAIATISKQFQERIQGINNEYFRFTENARHLYEP